MSTTELQGFDKIQEQSTAIKEGSGGRLAPGQPTAFSEASTINDTIPQGDLYLAIRGTPTEEAEIPEDFELRLLENTSEVQLVPGNTVGSKHVASGADFELWAAKDWPKDLETTQGPYLVAHSPVEVKHPTHGNVTIPAGFTVECFYQREWEAEQRRERRNAD